VSFFRLRGGKIVEHWGLQDGLALMIQLGVFAPPGA
jgi:predicted ester cyclase